MVLYLSARIVNDKSAFSPVIDFFEMQTDINK